MRFATERLLVASVSNPAPAKAGAELTFDSYILYEGLNISIENLKIQTGLG